MSSGNTQTGVESLPVKNHFLKASYPSIVISLCACFLFYKYILQVYPGIITDQLMHEFQLSGAGLGNLAATFYYSYMITQLFVGVMLDKYGTRLLAAFAIFCCALGVFLFSQYHTLLAACLSRTLMGVGVAFATVVYMKLASVWFPPRQYAFVGGLLATAAMAGAVFGEAPLSMLIETTSWRHCLFIIGLVGFGLAVFFIVIVRDKPAYEPASINTSGSGISMQDVAQVLKSKQNWLLTLYSGLAFSPIAVFGGLWGNPFLQEAYSLTKTQAASLNSLVFIGLGLGSPILGMLSDRLGNRRHVMFYSTMFSCISLLMVLYSNNMPQWLLGFFLFMFGFAIGAFMLGFTIGKESNKAALTATVIAMINASDAILDAITEPAIGKLLDWNWSGTIVNGAHYFSVSSYHLALAVLPIYLAIATVLILFIKSR